MSPNGFIGFDFGEMFELWPYTSNYISLIWFLGSITLLCIIYILWGRQ